MPYYQIVPAGWKDLNGLRRLETECFPVDAWPLWDLVSILAISRIVRYKAVISEKLVGFIAGDPQVNDGAGWITTLGVLRDYRQRGIASALLEKCEESMKNSVIKLCVRASNARAVKLYLDHGYIEAGRKHAYYIGGEDALVLAKYFR